MEYIGGISGKGGSMAKILASMCVSDMVSDNSNKYPNHQPHCKRKSSISTSEFNRRKTKKNISKKSKKCNRKR